MIRSRNAYTRKHWTESFRSNPRHTLYWINKLPEDYRQRAYKAIEQQGLYNFDPTSYALHEAVSNAFVWSATEEGERFWGEVYRIVSRNGSLPSVNSLINSL